MLGLGTRVLGLGTGALREDGVLGARGARDGSDRGCIKIEQGMARTVGD